MSARAVIRTGLTLAVIAAVCTALVAATYRLTSERIAENARLLLERSLAPALGATRHDGKLTDSVLVVQPPHGLPGSGPATVYRVFADGRPAAALFVVTALDGYSGPIRIVVGVDPNGIVTGLRILEHRVTGASITPRAVTKAVRDVLIYFAAHRDDIFIRPAMEQSQ